MEDKGSFNKCNVHNVFKFCMSCMGFEKNHPITCGILDVYRNNSFDIIDNGFENMDVSSFTIRYLANNGLSLVEYYDIDNPDKLYCELGSITKFDGKHISLLPPCLFDYKYADEPLHELMYASHKHWMLWGPKYAEGVEKVRLCKSLIEDLTDDIMDGITERIGLIVRECFRDEVKHRITAMLRDNFDGRMDFRLI